jgi:RND family efflux transporter MFP subunit
MRSLNSRRSIALAIVASALLVAGCEEEAEISAPPPIRSIKYMKLEDGAAIQKRRISGVIAAVATSEVAFQTGGQVVKLNKKVGDIVKSGEVVAELDPEPLRLRLATAQAELAKANASVADNESKFSQQKSLFDKGYATRTNYESALAAMRTSKGARGVAQSQVQIARRDLRKASLVAPFSGVVAKQSIDQYEEVASGQGIYTIQSAGDAEVRVSLPETLINAVSVGDKAEVLVDLVTTKPLPGRVTEIAPIAEGVNAYPVTVRLDEAPDALRPGMSAEVVFAFLPEQVQGVFQIPIPAYRAHTDREGGQVYVFESGKLAARQVTVVEVSGNALQITGAVKPGEIIATAGISLLYDGMPARLLDPAKLR